MNDQVYRELITYKLADPTTIDRATYLIWASHNLERIADRTTNICERVAAAGSCRSPAVYLVTGSRQELQVSSY
jgi:phosphate transport system protein